MNLTGGGLPRPLATARSGYVAAKKLALPTTREFGRRGQVVRAPPGLAAFADVNLTACFIF
jgi:hypothetical protein